MDKENKLKLYKDEEGRLSVNTLFADEDVWLTQVRRNIDHYNLDMIISLGYRI